MAKLEIFRVENGFIVKKITDKDEEEHFVFENAVNLGAFIADYYKEKQAETGAES